MIARNTRVWLRFNKETRLLVSSEELQECCSCMILVEVERRPAPFGVQVVGRSDRGNFQDLRILPGGSCKTPWRQTWTARLASLVVGDDVAAAPQRLAHDYETALRLPAINVNYYCR